MAKQGGIEMEGVVTEVLPDRNYRVLLENGQVVAEAEDDADFYGYYSAEVTLPAGTEAEATVRVTTGDRAQPDSEGTVNFNIVPPS